MYIKYLDIIFLAIIYIVFYVKSSQYFNFKIVIFSYIFIRSFYFHRRLVQRNRVKKKIGNAHPALLQNLYSTLQHTKIYPPLNLKKKLICSIKQCNFLFDSISVKERQQTHVCVLNKDIFFVFHDNRKVAAILLQHYNTFVAEKKIKELEISNRTISHYVTEKKI